MPVPPVFAIDGVVRDYAWGSTTAIQRLLGRPVDGRPAAELWFGAHPDDPSFAPGLGQRLDAVIAADPAGLLGPASVERFGPRLPFLLKVLAASTSISMQVHPNQTQAAAGFAKENAAGVPMDAPGRNYRDPNHKPELVCAVTEFEALCGFRPVQDTLRLLDDWQVAELAPVRDLLAGRDGLRAAFTYLLTLGRADELVRAVVKRAAEIDSGEWVGVAHAIGLIDHDFPGDIGAPLALLLNHVVLQPGEAIYLGAGNVHAYVRGVGVEILANSDNVLRCALTPKHVDVPELLRVTDFSELAQPRWPSRGDDGWGHDFAVPVPDFALHSVQLDAYRNPGHDVGSCAIGTEGHAYVVLCLTGGVEVEVDGTVVALAPGHAAFVPVRGTAFALRGTGQTFLATTGG